MTLLYRDALFLDHDTGAHPERAERLEHVHRHLTRIGLDEKCRSPAWEPAETATLALLHSRDYIARLDAFARQGGGRIEADTIVGSRSFDVACRAAGAVCDAVARVVAGEDRQALCLVRPPGHHALNTGAMGFCLFNNVALGAAVATRTLGVDRVLIVDWDVHHGNGTQDAFWRDARVGFFSIHRWPFYPGTGDEDETGAGDGLGTTLNVSVEFGASRVEYIERYRAALFRFAEKIRPDLVLVSAGFDSHRDDPVGSLGLETEDFIPLTQAVLDVADQFAEGRLVSVLEGGYNPGVLAGCVAVHLEELLARESQENG